MTQNELNAALDLTRKIERLQDRLDDLRITGGVGSPSSNTPVQGGAGGVTVGQVAAELEIEIADLRRQREIEQAVIGRYLEKTKLDGVELKLMQLRYVECRPWKMISVSLGYSHSRTMHYHAQAIEKTGHHKTAQDLRTACQ